MFDALAFVQRELSKNPHPKTHTRKISPAPRYEAKTTGRVTDDPQKYTGAEYRPAGNYGYQGRYVSR